MKGGTDGETEAKWIIACPRPKREKCLELPSIKGRSCVPSGKSEFQESDVWGGVVINLGRVSLSGHEYVRVCVCAQGHPL